MSSKIFTFFYLLSHILVQVQNERFHHQGHSPSSSQKLFSLCSCRAILQLQFLGNFSSGWEVGQKGLPVDSCTNIESSHATATNQCQTDFREKADSTSESENFLEWHNQQVLDSPHRKKLFQADIGFQNWRKELYPGFICECQYILAPSKIWRGSTLNIAE